jgi:hypothetical protein
MMLILASLMANWVFLSKTNTVWAWLELNPKNNNKMRVGNSLFILMLLQI